ncbi:MAG TPA: UvrD-helicase domain-containing protein [Gammaproteobacteria bacterium]|nr:UvrD-helicase domain-containing protein [Gammaproteobacteria bacterium]
MTAAENGRRSETADAGAEREGIDVAARHEALDPGRSFIVEAPAGSGKTELLIQRYLRLLARVERPEQIVAITFTRKAAAEMRARVVATFAAAAAGSDAVPGHRRVSIELAQAALMHARSMGWSLIDQPGRLRIMTIDALNTGLARQLPILANGIASLAVADDTSELYALAAKRATESLAEAGPLGEALRALLAGADNSLTVLEERLAGSLPQRDRWLRALARSGESSAAESVARSLERLASERLEAARGLVGARDEARLFQILDHRGDTHSAWRAAAKVLLTRSGEWRQRLTRREGFPADDKARRERAVSLLEDLKARTGLREALAALAALPPLVPSAAQTRQLAAVDVVLPRLLAELRVLFEEKGAVDYTELSLAAQLALGAVEAPSDLLLALDRRIEHMLVDEFQDTSRLQWRLLELLTSGWQAGDGRTLLLVGDPMQSIYRFRDADLSLFLRARRHGLGGVELTPIELRENHRSAREVVDWVNSAFAPVFPVEDRLESLAPRWRSSVSSRGTSPDARVELIVHADERYEAEIARVVRIVRDELARAPGQSIGILVRSRTHLAGLRVALARAGVSAHAVEIDSLTDTQIGQDLIGLTQALTHPGDRLAWLGLLRSPWCGLGWADLLALCRDEGDEPDGADARERTVWERLSDPVCRARLSDDGRRRAEWIAERLGRAFSLRATRSFGRWLRDAWLLIDGPAALADAGALELAESYFVAAEQLARDGDVDDPAELRRHFASPAATDAPLESGVEIMTMHRAKGLEFDCVVLPGLSRTIRGSESKLLYNIELNLSDDDDMSLLAASAGGSDPVVDYIGAIEREREAAERGRLLYVAATRARTRLYLLGSLDPRTGTPRGGSLLATLWPGLGDTAPIAPIAPIAPAEPAAGPVAGGFVSIPLKRLAFDRGLPDPAVVCEHTEDRGRPEFEWVRPTSVQVGTLIHRELQRLAEAGARAGRPVPPVIDADRYGRELALLGVEREDLTAAAKRVAEALDRVWGDSVGRWILEPRPEAWTELRLTLRDRGRLEHAQLDRSFVDEDGTRWIVDYKTGRHLGGEVEAFLDAEVDRYREQLERYASAVAETETRRIRVGLYFPLMTELRSWEPAGSSGAG